MCAAITGSPVFTSSVTTVVEQLGLHESTWRSELWKNLWTMVDQTTLDEAFSLNSHVFEVFSSLGNVSARDYSKSLARIQKKILEQYPGKENYFKVVSDFIAVRVTCEVTEIQAKIDLIREIVLKNEGTMHIRGSSKEQPYGSFMRDDNTYSDIVQFVYVFLPKIASYPIEIQVIHELAALTFQIDSELRGDNPACPKSSASKIDLWTKDFYPDGKQRLLNTANGVEPGSKEPLMAKAFDIHQGALPKELKSILDRM